MTILPQTVGMMPSAEAIQLVLEARYSYLIPGGAPMEGVAPFFTRVERVSKDVPFKALKLKSKGFGAIPSKGQCDTNGSWGKGSQVSQSELTFYAHDYEMSGPICAKDFINLCNAWEASARDLKLNPQAHMSMLLKAVIALKLQDMRDDFGRLAWFAKEGFDLSTTAPFYASEWPSDTAQEMLGGSGKCKGVWANIVENIVAGKTPYVDSNNGTAPNILHPNNIADFLQSMIDNANPELRAMKSKTPNAPFFLVDRAIFEAYRRSLVSVHNAEAWRMGQKGTDVANVLEYNGYLIYCDEDAYDFDSHMGALTTTALTITTPDGPTTRNVIHGRNLRAIFTAPYNGRLGTDMFTTAMEGEDIGIAVQKAPSYRQAGQLEYLMTMSVGTGIMSPELMVAAYASNTATFPAV